MNTLASAYFRIHSDHAILSVKLQPSARGNAIVGIEDIGNGEVALKIKLSAPPVDGKANAALLALLADTFDIPKSTLTLVQGTSSRLKRVRIDAPPETLAAVQTKLEENHGNNH